MKVWGVSFMWGGVVPLVGVLNAGAAIIVEERERQRYTILVRLLWCRSVIYYGIGVSKR